MERFKGTPGPWRVCDEDITFSHVASDVYHQIKSGGGYHDARENKGFCLSGYMSISDADLIAAAPELLEALQAIVIGTTAFHSALEVEHDFDGVAMIEMAKSAINKALGGE